MFGLCVRFTCKDETSAKEYDRLVAETVEQIKAHEPGTLVYAAHRVDGEPLVRIFYELYRDKAEAQAEGAVCDMGLHMRAGDGNRTRIISLGICPVTADGAAELVHQVPASDRD